MLIVLMPINQTGMGEITPDGKKLHDNVDTRTSL
jgi:hypothetical protein